MKIPAHLKHKPIIQVENYDRIDGPHADDTDAMGLSVGIAQWNTPGWTELSAKVWRNTGEKWSRQIRRAASSPGNRPCNSDLYHHGLQ
ncbi:DUF6530 family protein [Klebsiella pneumoniae]|uniref:DUF6530 family protein n=1 Tax=Klebsiella pneumoniae TaxID=573 RepID=UPI00223297F7|nr:DUF6530 family protein [Klebsiella pneumoniae]